METCTGKCACGKVSYTLAGPFEGVISCHCKMCQRFHGNYNPLIVGDKSNFILKGEENVTWYASSPESQRGFCTICGSAMFKRDLDGPKIRISAGCIDDTSEFKNIKNVGTESAGHYYVMPPEENVQE